MQMMTFKIIRWILFFIKTKPFSFLQTLAGKPLSSKSRGHAEVNIENPTFSCKCYR